MIGPAAGGRNWIAAGLIHLRLGFTGLSATMQTVLKQDFRRPRIRLFVEGVAISATCHAGIGVVCDCFRSGWNVEGSVRPKPESRTYLAMSGSPDSNDNDSPFSAEKERQSVDNVVTPILHSPVSIGLDFREDGHNRTVSAVD